MYRNEMKPPNPSSSFRKSPRLSPYLFSLLAFIVVVTILYGEDFRCILYQLDSGTKPNLSSISKTSITLKNYIYNKKYLLLWEAEWIWFGFVLVVEKNSNNEKVAFAVRKTDQGGCDLFKGRWVWDESTRPLYEESECPYIQPQLTCLEHGRPERNYQYWRWQPDGCSLARFVPSS